MKVKKISLYTATLLFTSSALAHGYVESPPSRAYQCHLGKNTDCGSVQWEPQSVEQASGFPEGAMPPDGKLVPARVKAISRSWIARARLAGRKPR